MAHSWMAIALTHEQMRCTKPVVGPSAGDPAVTDVRKFSFCIYLRAWDLHALNVCSVQGFKIHSNDAKQKDI